MITVKTRRFLYTMAADLWIAISVVLSGTYFYGDKDMQSVLFGSALIAFAVGLFAVKGTYDEKITLSGVSLRYSELADILFEELDKNDLLQYFNDDLYWKTVEYAAENIKRYNMELTLAVKRAVSVTLVDRDIFSSGYDLDI